MFINQYFPGDGAEAMENELFKACHESHAIETIPTLFYYEGCTESKMFNFMYPSKLSKEIHRNIGVFASRGWNAVVHIDEIGLTHVFFGKNDGELRLPDVFNNAIQGSC